MSSPEVLSQEVSQTRVFSERYRCSSHLYLSDRNNAVILSATIKVITLTKGVSKLFDRFMVR